MSDKDTKNKEQENTKIEEKSVEKIDNSTQKKSAEAAVEHKTEKIEQDLKTETSHADSKDNSNVENTGQDTNVENTDQDSKGEKPKQDSIAENSNANLNDDTCKKADSRTSTDPAKDTEKSQADTNSSADSTKQKLLHFIDRRNYNVAQNLRLAGVAALLIFLIGIFQPLIGVNFGISVKGDHDNNPATADVTKPIFSSGSEFTQVNLGDMALQKPLHEYEVFGNEIDDIEILGLNLYEFARAPFPDFTVLKDLDHALDSETLQFLKSPEFTEMCNKFLGEYADSVLSITNTLLNLSTNAGDVLDKIIDVFTNLSYAKASLNAAIDAAENVVDTVNGIALFIVLVMLAGIILFIIGKGPRYLSPIMLTPFTILFLVLGIGFLVGNNIIAGYLEPMQQAFNDGIKNYLLTAMPQVYQTIDNVAHLSNMNLIVSFSILAGAGWWLTTAALAYVNVTGYVLAKRSKIEKIAK